MEWDWQALVLNAHVRGRTRSWLSVYKMSEMCSVQVCRAQISGAHAPCSPCVSPHTSSALAAPGHFRALYRAQYFATKSTKGERQFWQKINDF